MKKLPFFRALVYSTIALLATFAILPGCDFTTKQASVKDSADKAPDWALLPFTKVDSLNPILNPGEGTFHDPILKKTINWEDKDVFNPAVILKDGKVFLIYRAEDKIGKFAGTSRIGLAESEDGLHFTKHPEPVLFPAEDAQKKYEWEGGCEDPRVVEDGKGLYIMTYTAYDGDKARLMVASSPDLVSWKKAGPAFSAAFNGKYRDKWSKSGSIISKYENGHITATKINGKYWMYWGDVNIWVASSDDLINWTPVELAKGEAPKTALKYQAATVPDLKSAMEPRQGLFDSDIIEPGPPAMITKDGILLLYNSRNIPKIGDSSLVEGTYTASQALFDAADPTKLISRMNKYFLKPDKDFETKGQINQVCFIEGLIDYKGKWFLYYGTADSKIAVAVKDQP